MAIKINSTVVFDNSGNVLLTSISGQPSGLIKSLSVTSVGDGAIPIGSAAAQINSISFNSGTGQLAVNFNTNCNCCNDCCYACCDSGGTCFVAGSKVTMLNGKCKNIEDVCVGESVLGFNNETVKVVYTKITRLGKRKLVIINDTHVTTTDHLHLTDSLKFSALDMDHAKNEFGQYFECLDVNKNKIMIQKPFIDMSLLEEIPLQVGDFLATLNGNKMIESISYENGDENLPLYTLITSGSHTFFVNDYCVDGFIDDGFKKKC